MNKREAAFLVLLAGPSLSVFVLSYVHSVPFLETILLALTFFAIAICPLVGALLFERNESIILSLLIPFALTAAKAANFDGAERLVVAGFVVFLMASILFWMLGCLIKYLYARYFQNAT